MSENLITWENSTSEKSLVSEFVLPESTFRGKGDGAIKVFYITDIHLLHHLDCSAIQKNAVDNNLFGQIRRIVKGLFNKDFSKAVLDYDEKISFPFCESRSDLNNIVVLFGGDISSSTKLTEFFYREFYIRWRLLSYSRWKENAIQAGESINELPKKYFDSVSQLDEENEKRVRARIAELNARKRSCYRMDEKYSRPERFPIYAVLGNHELIDFSTVQDAVKHYKEFFKSCHIHFLQNESIIGFRFNIVGGIGFAKYNYRYNATTLQTTTPPMSRENEIQESEMFADAYHDALLKGCQNLNVLIVLTHYPVGDWLSERVERNTICVYFNGHNHTNKSEASNVYADNQIGYRRKRIEFKSCFLGLLFNPFFSYRDGCYEITPIQYQVFCRYKGGANIWNLGDRSTIAKSRC